MRNAGKSKIEGCKIMSCMEKANIYIYGQRKVQYSLLAEDKNKKKKRMV